MKATAPTQWVKVSSLVPGRNPRGESFKVDDLVESFGRNPMMHNIVARPLPGERDRYEVVAGHRRLAAAKQKGWAQVEVKVIEADDALAEQLALEENLRREDLADEAGALARLAELYERQQPTRRGGDRRSKRFKAAKLAASVGSVARVAQVTGQSVRDTRRKIRVAKLASAQVKKAFVAGRINVLEAETLVRVPKRKQDRQLAALVKKKTELPPELRRVLEALQHVELQLARWKKGIAKATLTELKALSARVVAAVEAIEGSSGRRRSRHQIAAKAVQVKPKGNVADAVSFETKSYNRKLSIVGSIAAEDRPRPLPMKPFVAATSLSIQTSCPDTCTFKGAPGAPGGCYADAGFTRIKIRQLDEAAVGFSSTDLVREEVRQLDAAFRGGRVPQDGARGGRDLRLHVAGDVQTAEEARMLGGAATRWRQRGGGQVWSFTHSWRAVPRSAWGPDVSVLASVESPRDIMLAKRRGYAAAVVVEKFGDEDRAFALEGARRTRVIPCPAETRGTNCAACRLCLRPDALLKTRAAIAFKTHGQQASRATTALHR